MKKRNFVRIISFLLTAVLVSFGFVLVLFRQNTVLQSRIEDEYFNSLNETAAKISEINYDLKKQLYCNSNSAKTAYFARICERASGAKECLARLPIKAQNAENIYKYLASVADYSKSMLSSKNSEKSKAGLKKLVDFSENLNADFNILQSKIKNRDDFEGDMKNLINNTLSKTSFSSDFENISQTSKTFPVLIYDGPFSKHIENIKPKLLKLKQKISKNQAKQTAKFILGTREVEYTGKENSNIESYTFKDKNGGVCAITKLGGYCLYLNKQSGKTGENISEKTAIKNAKNYLKTVYNADFKESYFEKSDNVITINFASVEKGVVCYSDLIKVGVSLENGKILSVEARGFIMNNHKRNIPKFSHPTDKIKKAVSDELKVKSINKSLILSDSQKEKYCYEVKCKTAEKSDVIVYLNKDSLEEENILFLIHSDNGTLTK